MPTIFISNECSTDPSVAEVITRLRSSPGMHVDQSPSNPSVGEDPRWRDWYAHGCNDAIGKADYFVAVVTPSYASTWMAHELDVAFKQFRQHGRPRVFLLKPTGRVLPLWFKSYEDLSTTLSGAPDSAVAELLAHVRAVESKQRP